MKRNRYKYGTIERKMRKKGPDVWVFRSYISEPDGNRKWASRLIGTVAQYPTKVLARKASEAFRIEANAERLDEMAVTFGGLIDRYKLDKLPERYSTRVSYLSCLKVHIRPRWGDYSLEKLGRSAYEVEKWFEGLTLAPKSKGHVKSIMHRLFECGMKWGMFPLGRNPMELVEIKGVSKRRKRARVLSYDEFWRLLSFIKDPYRTMVLTAQCLGLRISEVMALQWGDFNFEDLTVRVERGIVHGHVDEVKTEYSEDDLPVAADLAQVLLDWRPLSTPTAEGWLFANPVTLWPYWQESACESYLKPAGVAAGLGNNITWHVFRHTYRVWLEASGTPVTLMRDLMRPASIQTTMDVYGRATMSEGKRLANSKVVRMALRSLPPESAAG